MYEIMDNLKDANRESLFWICEIRFISIFMFFAFVPNICGVPLTWFDCICLGMAIPYLYFCYLKLKELKDEFRLPLL